MPEITPEDEVRYQSIVFLNAVVPVLKPIINDTPALAKAFAGLDGVVQISAKAEDVSEGKVGTHLVVESGEVTVKLGLHPAPNVEIEFGNRKKLNDFFLGDMNLPKFRGVIGNTKLFAATIRALLRMSSLLGATTPPDDEDEQALLVKCMFYLLTSGISQLNKARHPVVRKWTEKQPDRVYELTVKGREDLDAYIRVKGGRSKAARGSYTRSKPFFAMAFDSTRSALGILLGTDDMVESTTSSKLIMEGAPEYGAELGDLMFLVGDYAKK